MGLLFLAAAVMVATVVMPPSVRGDAKRMIGDSLDVIEQALAQVSERVADWIGRDVDTVPDAPTQGSAGVTLSGRVRVVDGDTLDVGGTRVRLYGIDAPESEQQCRVGDRILSCGLGAARALARRIGSASVACEVRDRDRYGRVVAVCRVEGVDVNAWMVDRGWAFAYRRYSMDYVAEEMAARAAKRGVWQGDVVAPWDWRRGERLAIDVVEPAIMSPATSRPTTWQGDGRYLVEDDIDEGELRISATSRPIVPQGGGQYVVEGDVNEGDLRIYHVPGGRFYDCTRIGTSMDERWLCTGAEAGVAGWRHSRQ